MSSLKKFLARWLETPQVTNRQALIVGVIGSVLASAVLYGGGKALAALDIIDFKSAVSVWLTALIAGAMLALGLFLGARKGAGVQRLEDQISNLQDRADELGAYEIYGEHLRDALADLRKALSGELPAFSLRDFIEGGLFVPAQRFLDRARPRGEIRLSILHPDGDDFVMTGPGGLHPAFGHSLEGRQRFRMPIDESFSMHAFHRGKVFASGKLSDDERFTPHHRAQRPYESIVSIPLWKQGRVDGVFNVVATEPDAFNAVDRSYLTLIGSVIDVARAFPSDVPEPEDDIAPSALDGPDHDQRQLPPGDQSD